MLWNVLRYTYRSAEPIHAKHWMSACSDILQENGFCNRPSVANWIYLLSRYCRVQCFSERRKRKIARWRYRAVFLVRKRVVALREFGVEEPTWGQVNTSVGGMDRPEVKVPLFTLADTLEALTAYSAPMSIADTAGDGIAYGRGSATAPKAAGPALPVRRKKLHSS